MNVETMDIKYCIRWPQSGSKCWNTCEESEWHCFRKWEKKSSFTNTLYNCICGFKYIWLIKIINLELKISHRLSPTSLRVRHLDWPKILVPLIEKVGESSFILSRLLFRLLWHLDPVHSPLPPCSIDSRDAWLILSKLKLGSQCWPWKQERP